jgi:hypothetical protein
MAKFRMVPDDAEEAKWIHDLMQANIAQNLPELSKDLKLMRKRLSSAERWEEIAKDLANEEAEAPSPNSAQGSLTPSSGSKPAAAPKTKPAPTAPATTTPAT